MDASLWLAIAALAVAGFHAWVAWRATQKARAAEELAKAQADALTKQAEELAKQAEELRLTRQIAQSVHVAARQATLSFRQIERRAKREGMPALLGEACVPRLEPRAGGRQGTYRGGS